MENSNSNLISYSENKHFSVFFFRLVSADIKQRLPVAKPSTAARKNNLKQQSEKSFQEDVFR